MKDCNGRKIKVGDIVVRHNANNGWACDDCEVPLIVIEAPEDSNRKYDLLNSNTGKAEHFVNRREWQDMSASGYVLYTYEIIKSLEDIIWGLFGDVVKKE